MLDYGDRKFTLVKVGPELLFKGEDGRIFNRPPKPRAGEDPEARKKAKRKQLQWREDWAEMLQQNMGCMCKGTRMSFRDWILDGVIYEIQDCDRTRLVRLNGEWFDKHGDVHPEPAWNYAIHVPHSMDGLDPEDWIELLSDYEIVQPIFQLGRPVMPPMTYMPPHNVPLQGIFSLGRVVKARWKGRLTSMSIHIPDVACYLWARLFPQYGWEVRLKNECRIYENNRVARDLLYRLKSIGGVEC